MTASDITDISDSKRSEYHAPKKPVSKKAEGLQQSDDTGASFFSCYGILSVQSFNEGSVD